METKVIELISEHFGVPVSEINPSMELKHDLNATDLEIADFFQKLEDTFKISITSEDSIHLVTVSDIIDFVADHAEETT